MAELPITALRVRLTVTSPLDLGPYAGFPLHGAVKHLLRHGESEAERAAYADLFEGGNGPPPHARFVLHADEPFRTRWAEGDALCIEFRLIGDGAEAHVSALRSALDRLQDRGIGVSGRAPGGVLVDQTEALALLLPETGPTGELVVELASPFRRGSMNGPSDIGRVTLQALAFAAAHRLRGLGYANGADLLSWVPAPREAARWAALSTSRRRMLRWVDLPRRTQSGAHPAGGARGRLRVAGVDPLLGRVLAAGACVHLGKLTPNGFGQIALWSRVA